MTRSTGFDDISNLHHGCTRLETNPIENGVPIPPAGTEVQEPTEPGRARTNAAQPPQQSVDEFEAS